MDCKRTKGINNSILNILVAIFMFLAGAATISGCSINNGAVNDQSDAYTDTASNTEYQSTVGIYDSEDTALVVRKDYEACTIQFQNIGTSRRYTLNFDGVTQAYDKYDQAVSLQQIEEGSIVTARFYKPKKLLTYVKVYDDCLNLNEISGYGIDLKKGTLTVGDGVYNISGHVVVSSDGKEVDLMDVNPMDVLSVWGYKNMIYAINIKHGHGYLRLLNNTYFTGGWLEVGDRVISKITEDMLVVVPEGTFNVTASNKGSSVTQQITFPRNEELAWNLGEVEITVVQKGVIIFTVSPANAKVTIDGKQIDISKPVELEYGLHQMRITAEGYDSLGQYIKIAEPSANIDVELEKAQEEEKQEESSETPENSDSSDENSGSTKKKTQYNKPEDSEEASSENSSKEDKKETESESSEKESSTSVVSSSSKYKVHIDAPSGVEAYLDGNYLGITPLEFDKVPGNYVVTLRKTGCQTRSYTIQLDEEKKDVNYSFAQLTEISE